MRRVALARIAVGICLAVTGEAAAGVKITETTRGYPIAGDTGAALLAAMDRRGPKHGFPGARHRADELLDLLDD